jgi:hypothetical protein
MAFALQNDTQRQNGARNNNEPILHEWICPFRLAAPCGELIWKTKPLLCEHAFLCGFRALENAPPET